MANRIRYNKKQLVAKCVKIIKEKRIIKLEHLHSHLPVAKATFYKYVEDDGLDEIKEAIEDQRVIIKSSLLKKWYISENPTLQIACFKQVADDDELRRLNNKEIYVESIKYEAPKILIENAKNNIE
jgi:hypothetical protein